MSGKRACVLLTEGFEETEAIAVIDVLRRAAIDTTIVGVTGREVTGNHGITVHAAALLADVPRDFDCVALPGGMPGAASLRDSVKVKDFVVTHHQNGAVLGAVCAAPIALAAFGLLEGKRVTCFPGFEDQLAGAVFVGGAVVVDVDERGRVVTGRAIGSALQFGLALVEQLGGAALAEPLRARLHLDS